MMHRSKSTRKVSRIESPLPAPESEEERLAAWYARNAERLKEEQALRARRNKEPGKAK